MRLKSILVLSLALLLGSSAVARAQSFEKIRVGDRDGFGFGDGAGLLNFEGDPVNVDGDDVLSEAPFADFLPDHNQDGLVQDGRGDDFDNRSTAEIAGASLQGSGFTDQGTSGSQFTDLSLSRSFDTTFPPPNDFPDPPANDRNDALFGFRFFVAEGKVTEGEPIFFNIVFGDIGFVAGELRIDFAGGGSIREPIEPINANIEDGLIRGAFLQLAFADVFTAAGGGWEGFADVRLVTRPGISGGDPYYALDYVELSRAPLTEVPASSSPGAITLGLALLATALPALRGPRGSAKVRVELAQAIHV